MSRNSLQIEYLPIASLKDNPRAARRHSKKKIGQLAESIRRLGFNCPLIIAADGLILAGHARVAAAKLVGMDELPVVRVSHLSELEGRAFMLAENKFGLNAHWDFEALALELQELVELEFDPVLTGFSVAEIDLAICSAEEAKAQRGGKSGNEDIIPDIPETPVTRAGDVWLLGRHSLLCGDARERISFEQLLKSERVHILLTDPPYNVVIPGNVSGSGKVRHDNFAMASGEMSEEQFTAFLETTLGHSAKACRDGAIAFVFMDWRHMGELLAAGRKVFSELKNLCVWNKTNGGMGAFYRSKHELVFVFKAGTAHHTNNFGLGDGGRYRTNVWDYAGISSMSSTRAEELEFHPTVKPVALVIDALKDCSKRGEIVLDPFGGSGTTLIAAEKCGRTARLIEYEPRYCDTIIARYEKLTGRQAILESTSETFEDVAELRAAPSMGEAA